MQLVVTSSNRPLRTVDAYLFELGLLADADVSLRREMQFFLENRRPSLTGQPMSIRDLIRDLELKIDILRVHNLKPPRGFDQVAGLLQALINDLRAY